jgi:hypothetical protein
MIQRGKDLRFALKAAGAFRVGGDGLGQHLDRHLPIEPRIDGAVDLAHSAGADQTDDLVSTKTSAWSQLHAGVWAELYADRKLGQRKSAPPSRVVRQSLHSAVDDVIRTELRREIREGDEETRRYVRVLHEEVLSRMAIIQEGLPRRRTR